MLVWQVEWMKRWLVDVLKIFDQGGIVMKLMDIIVEEYNKNLTEEQKAAGEKVERLYSEQYQIVQTENGKFHVPVKIDK